MSKYRMNRRSLLLMPTYTSPPIHKILYVDSPGTILRNLASLCLLEICENPLQICGEIAGRASRDRTVVVRSVF